MNRTLSPHENLRKNDTYRSIFLPFFFAAGRYFILLFCIFGLNIGFSQDNTNDSIFYSSKEREIVFLDKYSTSLSVVIGYYNKRMYYVNSPIIIEFQITNTATDPVLFITSFNKMYTFDFEVLTSSNRRVPHSREYTIGTTQFEPILNDEITLKKDEVYGVRIDISKWFDLYDPGEYILRGLFFPNLNTGSEDDIRIYSENELHINLNPPYSERIRRKREIEEIKKLKAESLPPYEVINIMLRALQEGEFDKYFLYIRFDKFIMQFSNARKKYIDAKDIDKPTVVDEFRAYLRGENDLEALPFSETIPADFEIERTVIEKKNATVTVIQTFKFLNLTEKKQYTYNLHLYRDRWLLESYSVVNIGK